MERVCGNLLGEIQERRFNFKKSKSGEYNYCFQVQSGKLLNPKIEIEGDHSKAKKVTGQIHIGKVLFVADITPHTLFASPYSLKVETGKGAKISYLLKSKNALSHTLTMSLKKAVLYPFLNRVKVLYSIIKRLRRNMNLILKLIVQLISPSILIPSLLPSSGSNMSLQCRLHIVMQ